MNIDEYSYLWETAASNLWFLYKLEITNGYVIVRMDASGSLYDLDVDDENLYNLLIQKMLDKGAKVLDADETEKLREELTGLKVDKEASRKIFGQIIADERVEHALGLVNYFSRMISLNGNDIEMLEGLKAAEQFHNLAEQNNIDIVQISTLLSYLKSSPYTNMGWLDMQNRVEAWLKNLQDNH